MKNTHMSGWEFLLAIIILGTLNIGLSRLFVAIDSLPGLIVLTAVFFGIYIYVVNERARSLGREGLLATYISMSIVATIGSFASFYIFLIGFFINLGLIIFMVCANAKETKINKLK